MDHFDKVRPPVSQGDPKKPQSETPVERYLGAPLNKIPLADLIDLYEAVKNALPPSKLQDIDLAQEIILQFMRVKELQTLTLGDGETPANQKAQVANSVSAILAQLMKLQTELHTAERFKILESILIQTLKDFPELADAFLLEYERVLEPL
jgi:hypothetical protein